MSEHTKEESRKEYAKEREKEHDESVLNPETKTEYDLSRKEKRDAEKEKLKTMSLTGKLEYIWMYYKVWIFGILAACLVLYEGINIYQHSKIKTVLTVSIVNTALSDSEPLGDEIQEVLGCTDDKYKTVNVYTSLTTEADEVTLGTNAQMLLTTQVASGTLDVLIMPEKMYDSLNADESEFMDLKELLGEETYSKFGDQSDSTCIKLNDQEMLDKFGVSYEPVCISVLINSLNTEEAAAWIASLQFTE